MECFVQALAALVANVEWCKDTVFEVAFEDEDGRCLEAGARGGELGQHVLTGAAFFEHAPEPADLTLDAGKAIEYCFITMRDRETALR
jgi:hypothetical protein